MELRAMIGTVGGGTDSDPMATLETDVVHHILQNERRRVIISLLRDRNEMRKCDVVDRVAEHEYARPISEIGQPERKRIYVSLVQCHFPKLVDEGVIDETDETLKPGPNISALYPHLDVDDTPVLRREW